MPQKQPQKLLFRSPQAREKMLSGILFQMPKRCIGELWPLYVTPCIELLGSTFCRHAGVTSRGLSAAEVERRTAKYGMNIMTPPNRKTLLAKLWEQVSNILIVLLIICAVISAGFQEWAELILIMAVIIINIAIGLIQVRRDEYIYCFRNTPHPLPFQEGKAEKAAEAIKKMLSATAVVMRDGQRIAVPAEQVNRSIALCRRFCCNHSRLVCRTLLDHPLRPLQVVPGDIVIVVSGDRVPCDIRILECNNIQARRE